MIPGDWNDLQPVGKQIFPTQRFVIRVNSLTTINLACPEQDAPAAQALRIVSSVDLTTQSVQEPPGQRRALLVNHAGKHVWIKPGMFKIWP